MRRAMQALLFTTAVTLVLSPLPARADGFISPWVGSNFGNSSAEGRTAVGASAGWMGAGVIGGEFDFGYAPNFFGSTGNFGDNHVMTGMANLILGIPVGGQHGAGIRPFASGGLGFIRTSIGGPAENDSFTDNKFSFNAGAGIMGYFSDHLGLRGDVRYFRNIKDNTTTNDFNLDLGGFHFWRAAFGVVIR